MYYDFKLTIPAQTTQDTPVTSEVEIIKGLLSYVEILFPPGCAALAKVQIWHKLRQLWPTNQGGYFADNDYRIRFEEDYPLKETPYLLKLVGWNDDDSYPHTITFRFGLRSLPKAALEKAVEFIIGQPQPTEGL